MSERDFTKNFDLTLQNMILLECMVKDLRQASACLYKLCKTGTEKKDKREKRRKKKYEHFFHRFKGIKFYMLYEKIDRKSKCFYKNYSHYETKLK